jgi:phosphatidylinositol alpha-1,6-mannosyltransferase
VLAFAFGFPPDEGGIARLCDELVAGLRRRGVVVEVLSKAAAGSASAPLAAVPVRRVWGRRPRRDLAAWRALRDAGPLAAVVCGLWYPEGLLAVLAGVRPLVILAHGPSSGRPASAGGAGCGEG